MGAAELPDAELRWVTQTRLARGPPRARLSLASPPEGSVHSYWAPRPRL